MNMGGVRLWSLWAKVGAVGDATALSAASRPVREAHRPQIRSLRRGRVEQHSGASEENELARYGQAFKNRAVARLLPPESAPLEAVAREVGISADTLERWRAEALAQPVQQRTWTAAARLGIGSSTALSMQSAGQPEVAQGPCTARFGGPAAGLGAGRGALSPAFSR
ncbi:MAG: transposase, partial [Silanimonas sp.]|nr:transposase [Silanimonas sp.]